MKVWRTIGTWLLCGALLFAVLVSQSVSVSGQETISAQMRMQLALLNRFLVGMTTITASFDQDYTQLFSSGTGTNQANALWQDDRTLAASTAETLDLNASLTDAFGNSVTCTKLKALVVKADSGNTNNVLVGGGATTITTMFTNANDQVILHPGGLYIYTAPDSTSAAMTAGASDLLAITNSAGSTTVDYEITVICAE